MWWPTGVLIAHAREQCRNGTYGPVHPHLWAGRSRLSPWQYVLSLGLAAAQKKGGPENKEV
jgi:hypothetical protein